MPFANKGSKMIKQVLEYHAKRYSLMQPCDAVKLLYQHDFGIGHMIRDSRSFTERLLREAAETPPRPDIELTEPVGNGIVRVMLNSPDISRISLETLAVCCLRTAEAFRSSPEDFSRHLKLLESCCRDRMFGFSPAELDEYLSAYRAEGCPPVSHSPIYRNTYHPAYRIVKGSLLFPVCN